jgi:hypothetical protein
LDLAGNISDVLKQFTAISLEEMDGVELMNRFDTKYLFSATKLPAFLQMLNGNYRILEIAGERSFPYSTLYLDTQDYLFYRQHVTGRLERHKIRYRTYLATGTTYLEIKKKTNKNKTVKWRMKNDSDPDSIDKKASDFISKHLPGSTLKLHPVLRNGFMRSTLVGIESKERITVDFRMDFETNDGTRIEMPYMAIVEYKSECSACHSPFRDAVRKSGIRPVGFSKYCTGNAILLDIPRKNILKEKILLLKKIEYEFLKSSVDR